jgi:hypothetical protein
MEKLEIYKEKIAPLMDSVFKVCEAENISFVSFFELGEKCAQSQIINEESGDMVKYLATSLDLARAAMGYNNEMYLNCTQHSERL